MSERARTWAGRLCVVLLAAACACGGDDDVDANPNGEPEVGAAASPLTLSWSNRSWVISPGFYSPGPNWWGGLGDTSTDTVSLKSDGLHLKIRKTNGKWYSAQLCTAQKMGFGQYQIKVVGPIDKFHKNIVFSMFHYPGQALDGYQEIDIEITRYGNANWSNGNYIVYPNNNSYPPAANSFNFTLNGTYSTHRYYWGSKSIFFQSLHGHTDTNTNQFKSWLFAPSAYLTRIAQQPQYLCMNLWLYGGKPPCEPDVAPCNLQTFEVVISQFKYTP